MSKTIEVGDYVEFTEPNLPRTGSFGTVEGTTLYTAHVAFEDGHQATWPKAYFTKREKQEKE